MMTFFLCIKEIFGFKAGLKRKRDALAFVTKEAQFKHIIVKHADLPFTLDYAVIKRYYGKISPELLLLKLFENSNFVEIKKLIKKFTITDFYNVLRLFPAAARFIKSHNYGDKIFEYFFKTQMDIKLFSCNIGVSDFSLKEKLEWSIENDNTDAVSGIIHYINNFSFQNCDFLYSQAILIAISKKQAVFVKMIVKSISRAGCAFEYYLAYTRALRANTEIIEIIIPEYLRLIKDKGFATTCCFHDIFNFAFKNKIPKLNFSDFKKEEFKKVELKRNSLVAEQKNAITRILTFIKKNYGALCNKELVLYSMRECFDGDPEFDYIYKIMNESK